jgi:5-methylcytosine-specific restriction enzyme A
MADQRTPRRLLKQRTAANENSTPPSTTGWGTPRSATLRQRARRALPYRCVVCGHDQQLELDHVENLAEGGSDDLSNVAWMCRPHHLAKTLAEAARGRRRANAQRAAQKHRPDEQHPGQL